MNNTDYTPSFFDAQIQESLSSAKVVVPIISKWFTIKSLIDVGCGMGAWTHTFQNVNQCEVKGMDGHYVNTDQLLFSPGDFVTANLNDTLPKMTKVDLAICLEVAEHLPKTRAQSFISELTQYSDVILFSAAVPNQDGTGHLNEQPLHYWIDLFDKNEFECVDCLRPVIWDNKAIMWWFRQNMVFFVRKGTLENLKINSLETFKNKNLISEELLDIWVHKKQFEEREKNELENRPIYALRVHLHKLRKKLFHKKEH